MKQSSSDFIAALAIHRDFRAQEEEMCHCFHITPFYLPWSNGSGCLIIIIIIIIIII